MLWLRKWKRIGAFVSQCWQLNIITQSGVKWCVIHSVFVPLTGAREGLRLSRWWKKILSLLELGGTLIMSLLALMRTRLGGWGFLNSWITQIKQTFIFADFPKSLVYFYVNYDKSKEGHSCLMRQRSFKCSVSLTCLGICPKLLMKPMVAVSFRGSLML